jgi:hypothetical protein
LFFGWGKGQAFRFLRFAKSRPFYFAADKLLSAKNDLDRQQKLIFGIYFEDIASRSVAQSCPYYVGVVVLR